MRRSLYFVAVAAIALMLHSCTTMYNSSSYGYGDLYTTNNRAEVANQLKAKAEIERAEAEARQAQWQAMQAEAAADRAEAEYYASLNSEPSFSSVLVTDYESAYARRLYGFQSPTYRLPASYYDLMTSSAYFYATAYDPAFYNVMVSGNQVWVEPKYVTSMFGTWGATNITFGIYASPWNYGWCYGVDPFYYSWWGYPHYSWYDWNWNLCYNPFHYDWYYWGYDPYHHHHHPHYGPGHGPGPRPPQHRPEHGYTPGHVTGPGASGGHPGHNLNGNRPNSGTRYTSPTTNRSYGSSGHSGGRPAYSGTISTGIYTGKDSKNSTNTTYREGSTNLNVTTRNNSNQSLNISSGGSSNRGNNNASATTTKRGDNYRQSNSTTSRSSDTNSSNNSYNSSSNYRSGNSTSSSRSSSSNYNRYDTDRDYNSTSNYRSNNNSSTSRSTGGFGSGSTSRSSSGGARSGCSTSSRR